MKLATILLAGSTLVATAALAQAEDMKAEVFTSWTSGGEQRALNVIKNQFVADGGDWSTSSIAGFESASAALQNRIVAGDPPTVYQAVMGKDQSEMVEGGVLRDLDAIAKKENWKAVMAPAMWKSINYDGHVYLAPTDIQGESWMFYSTAAFEKAGIKEAPKDWDTFFADMDKLKAAGLIPIAWGGQSWQEAKVFNMILLSQVGMDDFMKIYVDHDQKVIQSDAVRKTLEIFAKLRNYIDDGAQGRNWNDATDMLITGKAGVQFTGDWAKGEFTAAGETAGKEFGCALAPASPGMVYIGDSFAFPQVGGKDKVAAQDDIAKIVMDPKIQTQFAIEKGGIPVRTDLDPSKFDMCTQLGMKMVSEGKIVPEHAITISPERVGALVDFVGNFFATPDANVDDAMKQFAEVFE